MWGAKLGGANGVRRSCFALLVGLSLAGCSPPTSNTTAAHKSPPSRALPDAECTVDDTKRLYSSVTEFLTAWNGHEGKKLDSLFAPTGWFALSSDPRQRQMVTVSGRQLDQTVKAYWAQGATLRYVQVLPANPKPGDTSVGTEVDGLTFHFPDGAYIRTANKFVVWCNYHALGQGMLFPLS